jgi:pimeloyl-ACP methyl ester carboxylesterase
VADVSQPLRTLVGRYDPSVFDIPSGSARIRLVVREEGAWDAIVDDSGALTLEPAQEGKRADAVLKADAVVWRMIARDVKGGMNAFQAGRLSMRRNLHLGVGFLAATSQDSPGRLRFRNVKTRLGNVSTLEAGEGPPVLLIHGLGATKAEFMPTVSALSDRHRVIAMDLPGFGDSDKPFPAPYDPPFFASWAESLLDELEIERAHVLGHSMGGRVALEFGLRNPDRTLGLILMTPSMAWLGNRRWANYLKLVRPELGILQPAPRPIIEEIVRRVVPGAADEWTRAGIEEFLRAYLTPRGRVAFYAAARNIYLEEPDGPDGFWTRLEALQGDALFVWGRRDTLVPIGFQRHVQRVLPHARHEVVDSGHVPQLESPTPTHAAIARFLRRRGAGRPIAANGAGGTARSAGAARLP